MDATYPVGNRFFAAEWETGNISSAHRSINKLLLGVLKQLLVGAAIIVPSRKMYYYLTDRVGNYQELEPYFPLWRAFGSIIEQGLLAIYEIEHDGVDPAAPRISKGTDGRALL